MYSKISKLIVNKREAIYKYVMLIPLLYMLHIHTEICLDVNRKRFGSLHSG